MLYTRTVNRALLQRCSPLGFAAGVVGLAHWPLARAVLPGLGVLSGGLGLVLLGLGAALALGLSDQLGQLPALSSRALFLAGGLVATCVGIHHVGRRVPSGDEVGYLLTAQSLWRDHDLDLRDNYARGEFREYIPGLRRLPGIRGRGGARVPLHRPLLPLLVSPAYAIAGRAGCVVLLSVLLSLLALVVRRLARNATGDESAALLAWAATLGPPAFYYAAFLYPEVPAALALATTLAIARGKDAWRGAASALATSCLPWLHPRLATGAAALGAVSFVRLSGRARAAFVATAAAMAAGYLVFNGTVYRSWLPLRAYRGTLGRAPAEQVLAGLLFDPSFGLLVWAPVFVLAFAGAFVAFRQRVPGRFAWLLVGMALVAPVATFGHWWGGYSPPARFAVVLVPILALLVAVRSAEHAPARRGLAHWATPLLALGFALTLFSFVFPERSLNVQGPGREPRIWAALAGEVSLARYLPRMALPAEPGATHLDAAADEKRVAVVWCVALLALLALDRLAARSDRVDRAFGSLALPLALFLALTVAVDGWARRSGGAVTPPPADGDTEEVGEDASP